MSTKLVQSQKYSIKSITIESFRGYNNPHSFTFAEPVTVFCGHNGNGKSSTLYAVEWCLFGKVEFLPSLEGQTRDEIINQFNDGGIASVKLVLQNGDGDVELERSKELGTRLTTFTIRTKDGEFVDDEAERKFYTLFNMTLDDFTRAVYLHQEAIRALLTDDLAKRDEALDSLFGLEKIRSIVSGIPIKKIREKIDKMVERKGKLNSQISGAIQFCNTEIGKLKEKASENGVSKEQWNIDYAVKTAESVIDEIIDLCKNSPQISPEINKPTQLDDFKSFKTKTKRVLDEIERTNVGVEGLTKLSSKKSNIDNLVTAIQNQEKPIAEIQAEIDGITSKFGERDEIERSLSISGQELDAENKRRNELDINSKLIADAIESLKLSTKSTCPVCENQIDVQKTIADLEERAGTLVATNISEIDKRIAELKQGISNLTEQKSNLTLYEGKLGTEKMTQDDLLSKLAAELEVDVSDKNKLLSAAEQTSKRYEAEIENLQRNSSAQVDQLQKIRGSLDSIGMAIDIIQKERDLGTLNNLNPQDSLEIENIDKAVSTLHELEDNLTKIIKASGKVQTELASKMISSSQQDIGNYYAKLCMHKHYDKIRIDVKARDVRGLVKNSYSIKAFNEKDGNETHVATRFSTGQMNCVALSVFFALTRALPVKLGFIILDDPSQNLDQEHKQALAEIISSISSERQVFIATQDMEFQDFLKEKHKDAEFYEFVGWDISGPKFN